jgi:hypothetical protein
VELGTIRHYAGEGQQQFSSQSVYLKVRTAALSNSRVSWWLITEANSVTAMLPTFRRYALSPLSILRKEAPVAPKRR